MQLWFWPNKWLNGKEKVDKESETEKEWGRWGRGLGLGLGLGPMGREWVTLLWVGMQFLGMLLFTYGYFSGDEKLMTASEEAAQRMRFPPKTVERMEAISGKCSKPMQKAIFNKMVFMVIDALRADFIPSLSNNSKLGFKEWTMPFTEELLRERKATGIISEAQTPTVTMPRVKALLSGTHPSFMDLIFNLNAAKFGDDNLVEQAFKHGKRILFYGDDTWLQMFPASVFVRSNGTSSFFATDYVEVDSNVTQNVLPELERLGEWDIMILHYLGVDHIGHAHGGATSRLLPSKLMEMDSVIRMIYESTQKELEPYLLVVTGDHGMTDAGNHGGSTSEEKDTAALFVSTADDPASSRENPGKQSPIFAKQVDTAVTISALLGLPIPGKSRGKLILPVLKAMKMTTGHKLCHLYANAVQMQKLDSPLVLQGLDSFVKAIDAHDRFMSGNSQKSWATMAIKLYMQYIEDIQMSVIIEKSHGSFRSVLAIGFALSVASAFGLLFNELDGRHFSVISHSYLRDPVTLLYFSHLAFYVINLSATSFIEKEEYYWHYMSSALVLFHSFLLRRRTGQQQHPAHHREKTSVRNLGFESLVNILACILVLAILRVTSGWNVFNESDLTDWLNEKRNGHLTSSLVIFSFVSIALLVPTKKYGKQQCLLLSGFFWIYLYRSDLGLLTSFRVPFFSQIAVPTMFKARLVYFHLSVLLLEGLLHKLKLGPNWAFLEDLLPKYSTSNPTHLPMAHLLRAVCTSWVLLSALLQKVENIPLLALNVVMEKALFYAIECSFKRERLGVCTVTYLTLAMSAFYSQGNSNNISTIDVSSGYIGLESYNAFLVGLLVICSTYSLYVFWMLMLFIRINEAKLSSFATFKFDRFMSCVNILLIFRFFAVSFYEFVAVLLQNHLFIWSVICPKFMYEASLTLLTNSILFVATLCHKLD